MRKLNPDEAMHLSLLPEPETALVYLANLETGMRPALAARRAGISLRGIAEWREESTTFDSLCTDAEDIGTASIDDIALEHVRNAAPGWSGAFKVLVQRRDRAYGDKHEFTGADGKPMQIEGIEIALVPAAKRAGEP